MPDYGKIGAKKDTYDDKRESDLGDLIIELNDVIERWFYDRGNPNSQDRLNDVLVITGVRTGELRTVQRPAPAEAPTNALPAAGQTTTPFNTVGGLIPALDASGNREGHGYANMDDARNAGYTELVLEADGATVKGVRKHAAAGSPMPPPTGTPVPSDPNSRPVKNKKGHVVKWVTKSDGNADPTLEAILKTDGSDVEFFQEKPRVVINRR